MARIWKEPRTKPDFELFDLHGYNGLPAPDVTSNSKLLPVFRYFVQVCSFTFHFGSIEQIRVTLSYYSKPIHPSSRLPDSKWLRAEHEVAQRWFERLPQFLLKEPKRKKVVKALEKALLEFDAQTKDPNIRN